MAVDLASVNPKPVPKKVRRGKLKYAKVRDTIVREIQKKNWAPGTRLPTDAEYAKRLKVDRLTVSRALNELAAQGRVIRRRGSGTYLGDLQHPPLIPGRHIRIGVFCRQAVSPEALKNTFIGAVFRGLLKHWGLDFADTSWVLGNGTGDTRGTWRSQQRSITMEVIGEPLGGKRGIPSVQSTDIKNLDACIALGIIDDPWLERLFAFGRPVVLVDNPDSKRVRQADMVYVDPLSAYRDAVSWLQQQGHARIGFLGLLTGQAVPPELEPDDNAVTEWVRTHKRDDPDSLLREQSWRVAMAESGLPVVDDRVSRIPYGPRHSPQEIRRILSLPVAVRPDAMLVTTREQADTFVRMMAENNHPPMPILVPSRKPLARPLIGLLQDCEAIGEAAGTLVIARLQRPERTNLRVGVAMRFQPPE